MKRLLILIIILLVGCTNGNNKSISPLPSTSPQASQPSPSFVKVENQVLSTFSTNLLDKKKSRLKNIEKAAEEINKAIIKPGETFSFNGTVGPRTVEKGYEKALTIVKKRKVMDYGGGVCQVSSTMYQAALAANLDITERHQHEKEVGYVKLGDDATVSYGSLDLKIKNNKDYPIKFRISVGKNSVDVSVLTAY